MAVQLRKMEEDSNVKEGARLKDYQGNMHYSNFSFNTINGFEPLLCILLLVYTKPFNTYST